MPTRVSFTDGNRRDTLQGQGSLIDGMVYFGLEVVSRVLREELDRGRIQSREG